jgi:hypothetical protein
VPLPMSRESGRARASRRGGRWIAPLAGLVLAASLARPARAQGGAEGEPASASPSVAWSVGAGSALALASMAVGGGLAGSSLDERRRKTGIEVMVGGLALSPVVSHLVAGEGKRAAVFGGITVGTAVVIGVFIETSDRILDSGRRYTRLPFGVAMAAELVAATGGLIDSLMAGERLRARPARVAVLPLFSGQGAGLAVAGAL